MEIVHFAEEDPAYSIVLYERLEGLEQGIPKPSELKKILPGQGKESGELKSLEEKGKDLLKGLPFGR